MHDTWLTRACQGMTMEYHLRGDGGLELDFSSCLCSRVGTPVGRSAFLTDHGAGLNLHREFTPTCTHPGRVGPAKRLAQPPDFGLRAETWVLALHKLW